MKMEQIVNIWLPQSDSYGHASLRLDADTYLSWWPDDGKKKRMMTFAGCMRANLAQDDISMEREPDHQHLVQGLRRETCLKRWQELKEYAPYEVFGTNCCWVVYEVLRVGGAPFESHSLWTPRKLHRYMLKWGGQIQSRRRYTSVSF